MDKHNSLSYRSGLLNDSLLGVSAGHWLSASYALLASLIGAYLGILFLVSGNLLAPIIAHAAYDVVALFVLARRVGASRG